MLVVDTELYLLKRHMHRSNKYSLYLLVYKEKSHHHVSLLRFYTIISWYDSDQPNVTMCPASGIELYGLSTDYALYHTNTPLSRCVLWKCSFLAYLSTILRLFGCQLVALL